MGRGLKPYRAVYMVTTEQVLPSGLKLWLLDGVYNIAMSDVLYDSTPRRCTLDGARPSVADLICLDVGDQDVLRLAEKYI